MKNKVLISVIIISVLVLVLLFVVIMYILDGITEPIVNLIQKTMFL